MHGVCVCVCVLLCTFNVCEDVHARIVNIHVCMYFMCVYHILC